MIVCVCNGLGERAVKSASRSGTPTGCPVAAYARLGCKPKCGQCLGFAREVLRAA